MIPAVVIYDFNKGIEKGWLSRLIENLFYPCIITYNSNTVQIWNEKTGEKQFDLIIDGKKLITHNHDDIVVYKKENQKETIIINFTCI